MKKINLTLLILLTLLSSLSAQKLQQPLEEFPMSNRGYALLKTGQVIEGRIISSSSSRGITQVNLQDESGEKHKISAAEIQEFAIAMNGAVRLQYLMERGSSVKKLLSKDQPTAKPNDFVIFRNTSLNGNKEILLQLLNPGFDEIFEVYYDPFARKTTALEGEYITWTGDKHRAYFISKNGGEPLKVKKGNYQKSFLELFGTCPQLLEVRKPKLQDLENHILLYQNYCSFN
ncbi:MAG: hypothetical protein LPK25_00775 [Cyclobacteriaceae bacterium]|nr:hypothetical protein [Cyclobacteriaceae bacterium]MDX5465354.1 hypothetical protein [Cyclobacteriaceae bacterium]